MNIFIRPTPRLCQNVVGHDALDDSVWHDRIRYSRVVIINPVVAAWRLMPDSLAFKILKIAYLSIAVKTA
jgi:hypothetical protein